jgi:hypothetical protein
MEVSPLHRAHLATLKSNGNVNMADTLQPKSLPGAKTLRDRLSAWDAKTDAKAPLTERQKDGFIELTTLSANRPLPTEVFGRPICCHSVVRLGGRYHRHKH